MKLSYKSHMILDMILSAGLDSLQFATFPTRYLSPIGGWEEERYLKRHIKSMHEKGLIIWDDSKESGKWVLKITAAGKQQLNYDVDPENHWSRAWDGTWSLIAFDLPATKQKLRKELLTWLRSRRFGKLQESLWISPCFDDSWNAEIAKTKFDPSGVSFLRGASFARSSDKDFVSKAWIFTEINRRYKLLIDFHTKTNPSDFEDAFATWIQRENQLWRDAFEIDPFLPTPLLPKGYLGKKAFALRNQAYARLNESNSV